MPIDYQIDAERRIVFATPKGTMTTEDLLQFIEEVWSRPDLRGFDELVDMSAVERVEYGSAWKVREIAGQAAQNDIPGVPTKFAIVAESDHHFKLGEMYRAFRDANPKSMREVRVFRGREEALRWLQEPRS